jgi:8-oxo-dGTP pyrophosphatase MutT (NUDIX family)
MTNLFDERFRQIAAARCAEFLRLEDPSAPLKRAAVAIVIAEAENGRDAAILLTRRTIGLRAHSGQWALPGGRCDEGETAAEAALRELAEELGLRLSAGDVLGLLDGYPTRSGYLITPVVIWAQSGGRLHPNPAEVQYVLRIPLAEIAKGSAVSFASIPESNRPLVRIWMAGNHVHAPTAAVIYQFLEVLAGRHTRVRDFEQPVFAWK